MVYIKRRISVTVNGQEEVISEEDFFSRTGPLVILGEPGSGKTEMVERLRPDGAGLFSAFSVMSFAEMPKAKTGIRIIIDGIDEVTAYGPNTVVGAILSKIREDDISHYILTCRAADWRDRLNSKAISDRWNKHPLVGTIIALDDRELVSFIEANSEGIDGEGFLSTARRHESVELLRNPQMLKMFLSTFGKGNWPNSRSELYEQACRVLIEESNESHKSLDDSRPPDETLLQAAGFICAQMVLGNKRLISLEGNSSEDTVRIQDILGSGFEEKAIRKVLSSKVFRSFGSRAVQVYHRTVAEFLAGRYIALELSGGLSLRRLEGLLYGNGHVVSSALRGLHAWIATMDGRNIARSFISRDPYGFFRYGDVLALDEDLSAHLLISLKELSLEDPYFRADDFQRANNSGLARPALKGHILEILRDNKTPLHLSHLILQVIRGTEVANLIVSDLCEIVLDTDRKAGERKAALSALMDVDDQPDAEGLFQKLTTLSDIDSLGVALHLIRRRVHLFLGQQIVFAVVSMSSAAKGRNQFGIGLGLAQELSDKQLLEILTTLDEPEDEDGQWLAEAVVDFLSETLHEVFKRGVVVEADLLWRRLYKMRRYTTYSRKHLGDATFNYFKVNVDLRRAVQMCGLWSNSDKVSIRGLFSLREVGEALALTEDDMIFHLNHVLEEKAKGDRWKEKWELLVWLITKVYDYSGAALEHASRQADATPELHVSLSNARIARQDSEEESERQRIAAEIQSDQENRVRHSDFARHRATIISGEDIESIHRIATTYLGMKGYPDATPEERVRSLVGESMLSEALGSFHSAIKRWGIPEPRALVEKRVLHNEYSQLDFVLIAYCRQIGQMDLVPMDIAIAALAVYSWGAYFISDQVGKPIQAMLEERVFSDPIVKEQFLRATIEPYFHVNIEFIPGLFRLAEEEDNKFGDVAGKLSTEWLHKHPNVSTQSLRYLLRTAVLFGQKTELLPLVLDRVKAESWKDLTEEGIWKGVLFVFQFEENTEIFEEYIFKDEATVVGFRDGVEIGLKAGALSSSQNYFLIDSFVDLFRNLGPASSRAVNADDPWTLMEFLERRVADLANDLSEEAPLLLSQLIAGRKGSVEFQDTVKHLHSEHMRMRAEISRRAVSFQDARVVLLNQAPSNASDLNALVLDELELLQRRLIDRPTGDYLTFWNRELPHDENYCRDRIASMLEPYLERAAIRCHIEGAMPDRMRCDVLVTLGGLNMPIEVKGQWNSELWVAASSQLKRYSEEFRSEGWGVYLVLWFGRVEKGKSKNLKRPPSKKVIESAPELLAELSEEYSGNISDKTRIFVLDLSKPLGKHR